MSSTLRHDASAGFNDIKGLPNFESSFPWWMILSLALILCVCWWLYRRYQSTSSALPTHSPLEVATAALRDETGSTKENALRISSALRGYIEELLPLNALESTTHELRLRLPTALRDSLRTQNSARREKIELDVLEVLSSCDRVIFQRESPESTALLAEARRKALETTQNLHRAQEDEKSSSVIAQSHEV